jgi:hypothetical protein
MATRYWIVSLPVQSPGATATSLWPRLQDAISRHSFDTPLYRVGNPVAFPPSFTPLAGIQSNHPHNTKLA